MELTIEKLTTLIEYHKHPAVSIYIPTHITGNQTLENPIRLKNQIRKCAKQLQQNGFTAQETQKFLTPANDLLADTIFFSYCSQGLALFLGPGFFEHYSVPIPFETNLLIADHFHIKPLIPNFTEDGKFYILSLTQNNVRFFRATRHHIEQAYVTDMPRNIDEMLRFYEFEKQVQAHTGDRRARQQNLIFHGTGVAGDQKLHKKDIDTFIHIVNHQLMKKIAADNIPLVIASVDFLSSCFKQASEYRYITEKTITGNPDLISSDQLRKQAWNIVAPIFQQQLEEALDIYGNLSNTKRACANIPAIVTAAHTGRVQTLFIDIEEYRWGQLDNKSNQIHVHPDYEPGDDDLIDLAAINTLAHKGKVYTLTKQKLPNNTPAAAILRY